MMSALIPVLISAVVLISISCCRGKCIRHQSEALLELKRGLIDPSNRLASWDSQADCCSWLGVICDNFTGHVVELHVQDLGGNISESLLQLKQLEHLDLSSNDFGQISIPGFFGFMSSLRSLNVSKAGFTATIPGSIGNLTSLNTLDLSYNDLVGEIPHQLGNLSNLQYISIHQYADSPVYVDKLDWVSGLSSLKFIDLSNVNLSIASDWDESLGKLPFLQQLHLSGCYLTQFPSFSNVSFSSISVLDLSANNFHRLNHSDIFSIMIGMASLRNLTSLTTLDLSENQFNFSLPTDLFGGLTQLDHLDLRRSQLKGQIPGSIGNLTSLSTLDLSDNNFEGLIPISLKSLCNLSSLSLSTTLLSQEVNEVIDILSHCGSEKLKSLDLSRSQFSGYLSNVLSKFKSLVALDVSRNLITGPLPASLGEMASLVSLDLSYNRLNGRLPLHFGMLENLVELDVSFNSLEGEVSEIHFENLHNLQDFDANENHLIWKVNPDWVPPFQLVSILRLRSCEVGPQFPTWLRHLKYLVELDWSNSNIHSLLPDWVFNFSSSLIELDLSYNQMYGMIPNSSIGLDFIDLSSNHFEGPLPELGNPRWIDLSHNLLSGSIHNFLCNKLIIGTETLILKGNHLNGEMPVDCWMNWTSLTFLELSNNNFSSNIPASIGSLIGLKMLILSNNSLIGNIPSTLQSCARLIALDLRGNKLSGEFPSWIGEHLRELKILNIRGNNFHGHMPNELCSLTGLQILDFANNNLSGTIPTCVGNLIGMSALIPSYSGYIILFATQVYVGRSKKWKGYTGSSEIVRKGQVVEYVSTLIFVQSLDLSDNSFVGEIPEGITKLSGLQSLNLSRNFLTGTIPKDIGAMERLEALDLSYNRLFGEIPQSMSDMNFLSNLNLFNNNLSGRIPSSTQLQSMDPSSFAGNKLCGPPLPDDCNPKKETPPSNEKGRENHGNETEAVDWFYFGVSLAPGFVVGFWCAVGPLAFNRRWRRKFFNILDLWWDKMWVWFHVKIVKFVRNCGY